MSKRSEFANESGVQKSLRRRLQNALFAGLYRFGGRVYDPLTRFLFGGAWDRWRASVIPFLPSGGHVLDLGCGTGALVDRLNIMGYVAFGIDREPSMLRRVQSYPGARSRIIRGDAGLLPFCSASFDACVATFPSRFVVEATTLDEVSRVLRPGGTFAVVLSGYTDDWPLKRRPIRLALRLFYGERDSQRLPESSLIAHPALTGEWRWLSHGQDHVLVWIGIREAKSESAS
ncbi:MAG TPA: class I SAM-dependent methyltransferase [Nitrolancea sp.]